MNAEWFYGRNKRGCEGIFPINYIDVRKPLTIETKKCEDSNLVNNKVRVLYNFNAETVEDLTLRVSLFY
jgi:hypothetical protein